MRAGISSLLLLLAACRSGGPASSVNGGDAGSCARLAPTTDGGTCPVAPSDGVVCDLTDIASGWCGAADCPQSVGCCGFGVHPGETCFAECGVCTSRQHDCVTQGACATDSDCSGTLPHICQNCPLDPSGQGSKGCAHWTCNAGQCEVAYCRPGLVCQAGKGCPSYYLPQLDRSCSTDGDCVVVMHAQSCCTTIASAVRSGQEGQFAANERQCMSIQDGFACGCAPAATTEDGVAFAGPGETLAASCVGGVCKAVVRGHFQCGSGTCDAGDSCCVAAGDGGACVYSCATTCPVVLDDAGGMLACHP